MPDHSRRASAVALWLLVLSTAAIAAAPADGDRDTAIRAHAAALETIDARSIDDVLAKLARDHFSKRFMAETSSEERRQLIEKIAAADAGMVMLSAKGDEITLSLQGPAGVAVIFRVASESPYRIDALRVDELAEPPPDIRLTWENAAQTFDELERDGFSGVVYLSRAGEVILREPYGSSNQALDYETRLDSIYGIGSIPIDFTVAMLYLLEQRDALGLDDTISRYLSDVPADKAGITLRHLISGASGLADFHDKPGDWDADLGWIDRDTAVNRILAQPLLFEPGSGDAHSHSAYGLAAAIVEIVTSKEYFEFLSDEFLQPAGMTRTGMYGMSGSFGIQDFAEGRGQRSVGIPNVPPNWGPTSWLVMGSGGMYSTLGDMLRFYAFVRSGVLLEPMYAQRWQGEGVGIGGSERGFYLFHAYRGREAEAIMLVNGDGLSPAMHSLSRAVEALVMHGE